MAYISQSCTTIMHVKGSEIAVAFSRLCSITMPTVIKLSQIEGEHASDPALVHLLKGTTSLKLLRVRFDDNISLYWDASKEAFVLMSPNLCAMLCFRLFTACLIPVVGQQFVKCTKSVYGFRWIKMSSNGAEFVYLVSALGSTNTTSNQKRSKCQTVDLTTFTFTF